TSALVIGYDHVRAYGLDLVQNVLLTSKANRDHQDQRGGPDHHAQSRKGEADLAGAERIDRQLGDLAEEHGLSGALQCLLERADPLQPTMVSLVLFEFQLFRRHGSKIKGRATSRIILNPLSRASCSGFG